MRLLLTLLLPLAAVAQDFSKDVAPILVSYCLGCHATNIKLGGLELDSVAGIQKGGAKGPVVVPGKSAESRLFQMIAGKLQPAMPMDGRTLAAGEVDAIRKWIDAGAKPPAEGAASKIATTVKIPDVKPRVPVKPQIFAMAWSPDGKLLALAGHKEVR